MKYNIKGDNYNKSKEVNLKKNMGGKYNKFT